MTIHIYRSAARAVMDFNLNLFVQPAARTLPAAGGNVATQTGLSLTVPAGATAGPTTFVIDERPAPARSSIGPYAPLRTVDFTATSAGGAPVTSFDPPLTFTITYSDEELAERGLSEGSLVVLYWEGDESFVAFPCETCTLDAEANRLTFPISHFSEYVLAAQARVYLPAIGG